MFINRKFLATEVYQEKDGNTFTFVHGCSSELRMLRLVHTPSFRAIGQCQDFEQESDFLANCSSKKSCTSKYFPFMISSKRTLVFIIVWRKWEDDHARVSELSTIDSDHIELRTSVIRLFSSRAWSCIFRSCQLLQWSALRSISVIGDRSMQQTVLVVSLLTVGAVGAAYKRLLCLYGSQKSVQRTSNRNWQRNLIDNFFAGYAKGLLYKFHQQLRLPTINLCSLVSYITRISNDPGGDWCDDARVPLFGGFDWWTRT